MSKKCALMAILAYVPALFPMEKDAAIPPATALVHAAALQAAAEPAATETPSSPKIDVKLDASARVDSPTPATLIFQHMNNGEFAAIDALFKSQPALIYEEKPTISGGPETVLAKFLRTVSARQTPDNLKYFETWLSYLDPNSSLAKSIGRELLSSISARKKDKVKGIFVNWLNRANALKASSPKAPFIVSPSDASIVTQHLGEREIKPTQKNLSAQFEEEAQNAGIVNGADKGKTEVVSAAPAARETLLYQEHARKVRAERKAQEEARLKAQQEEAEQKAKSASQEDPKLLSQDDVLRLSFGGLMKTEVNPSALIDSKKDGAELVAPVIPTVVEDEKNVDKADPATERVSFADVVAEAAADVKKRNQAIADKVAASKEIKGHVLAEDSVAGAAHEEAALMAQEEARQRAEQEKAERKVHADIEEAAAKLRADAEAARKEIEDLEKKDAGSLSGANAAIKELFGAQKKEDEEAARKEVEKTKKAEENAAAEADYRSAQRLARLKAARDSRAREEEGRLAKEKAEEKAKAELKALAEDAMRKEEAGLRAGQDLKAAEDLRAREAAQKAKEEADARAVLRQARLKELRAGEAERAAKGKVEERAKTSRDAVEIPSSKALAEDAKRKDEAAPRSGQDLKAAEDLRAREAAQKAKEEADARAVLRQARLKAIREKNSI